MGTMFIINFPQFVLPNSDWLSPFFSDVARMEHGALHFTSREKPLLVILYVFSVLFITTLTAGVKWETSRKNLPRLPSGKVELKLERGITWTKAPLGREWEWKRKERKGDRSSVMGCRCSVLGMIKQWGWIRALSYDKHMHTHIHTQTHTYTPLCLHHLKAPTSPWMGLIAQPWLILGYMSNPGEPPIGMEILMEWSRRAAGNGKSPAVGMQRKSMWDQALARQPWVLIYSEAQLLMS